MSKRYDVSSQFKGRPRQSRSEDTEDDQFLFVNRDPTTISQSTRSREVSTHVQSSHRKISPSAIINPDLKDVTLESPKPSVVPKRGGEIQPWRADRPIRTEEKPVDVEANTEGPEDRTTLDNKSEIEMGSFDSFSALPFPADPVTNRILAWYRDDGIPRLFSIEKAVAGSIGPLARATWKRVISSLQSPSLAQPHLASICAYMAWQTKSDVIREFALQLKGNAYSILREQLSHGDEANRDDTTRMMLDLFWAEQTTESHAAAETHLIPLVKSLEDFQPSQVSSECRLELLYADNSLAVSKMTMPLLSGHAWVMQGMHEEWTSLFGDADSRRLVQGALELNEIVTDSKLRLILIKTREVIAELELALTRNIRDYSVVRRMHLRLQSCVSGLLTLSCEYEDRHSQQSQGMLILPQSSFLNHCACLTAVAWVFATWPVEARCTRQGLADTLESAQRRCNFEESSHSEARKLELWSFYAGRELQSKIEVENGKHSGTGWHTDKFEQLRSRLEQEEGLEIGAILGKFLHSTALEELGVAQK